MTFPLLLLALFLCGFAVSASICAVLLKREIEQWWEDNYGCDRGIVQRHEWIRYRCVEVCPRDDGKRASH
jgi:hypothetical protein